METKRAYFDDTYCFEDKAVITGCGQDENGYYLLLDQTIFYPQGGGQPSDQGNLQGTDVLIPIHQVKSMGPEIRHYTKENCNQWVDHKVKCIINRDLRLTHAKLHSAGHFIRGIVERLYPSWRAIKGHHFPDQCYVEFQSKNGAMTSVAIERLQEEIERLAQADCQIEVIQVTGDQATALCHDTPYITRGEHLVRLVQIGDFPYDACGGTHIKSVTELHGLAIMQAKVKQGRLKVKYDIQQS